jgi:uncharacterized membrane protein YdjX (TVP38/TMEM64 family)
MHTKAHYKLAGWLGLFAIALVGVCLYSPVKLLFNEAFLTTEFRQLGGTAPFWFVVLFTVALAVGLPGNVLAVAGGAVFGLTWGTVWSLLGSTLGAVAAFLLARYLLRQWIKQRLGQHPWLLRLNRTVAQHPFTVVLATRFTPLSPFSLVNFLFGLTDIDLKTYLLGTVLGLVPLTIAYSWLGTSGYGVLQGGDRLSLYLALGFLTVLAVLPIIIKKPRR